VVRTEARMREHGEVWPTMRKDIVEFVASCVICSSGEIVTKVLGIDTGQ